VVITGQEGAKWPTQNLRYMILPQKTPTVHVHSVGNMGMLATKLLTEWRKRRCEQTAFAK
jgi:hypothetical protein